MSIRVISWVMNHAPTKKAADVLVLVAIGDHCDHNGKGAYPSYTTLQEKTRLRRQSLSDILKRLESNPCLSVTKGTRQRANRYEIRIAPVAGCDQICCNWQGRRSAQLSLSLLNIVEPPKTPEVVHTGGHVVNEEGWSARGTTVVRTGDHGGPHGGLDPSDPSDPSEEEREYALPCATPSAGLFAEPGPEILRTMWNELTQPPIPRCLELTKRRRASAKACLQHHGVDAMGGVFKRVNASDFLRGSKGWTASFDWALKEGNITKVLEGNYDNSKNGDQHQQRPPGRTGAPAPGKYAALTKGTAR